MATATVPIPSDATVADSATASASPVGAATSVPIPDGATVGGQPVATSTISQQDYRKATAAGPFTQPGGAERAMGEVIGGNKAQAQEGLRNLGIATAATAAGVTGASIAPELLPAGEKILQISEKALETFGEHYPQLTKLAAKLGYGAGATGAYAILKKLGL